MKAYPTR